jgi:hypothetical protein
VVAIAVVAGAVAATTICGLRYHGQLKVEAVTWLLGGGNGRGDGGGGETGTWPVREVVVMVVRVHTTLPFLLSVVCPHQLLFSLLQCCFMLVLGLHLHPPDLCVLGPSFVSVSDTVSFHRIIVLPLDITY